MLRTIRPWRSFAVLVAVAALAGECSAQLPVSSEYRHKAHFLVHTPGIVQWPEGAFHSNAQPISICVFGDFPFGTSLAENARALRIQGRALEIRWLRAETDLASCRILFITRSESARYARILSLVGQAPVLTIGETQDFLARGGMIALAPAGEALQFDVNLPAAFASHLRISSSFLALARRVIKSPESAGI